MTTALHPSVPTVPGRRGPVIRCLCCGLHWLRLADYLAHHRERSGGAA